MLCDESWWVVHNNFPKRVLNGGDGEGGEQETRKKWKRWACILPFHFNSDLLGVLFVPFFCSKMDSFLNDPNPKKQTYAPMPISKKYFVGELKQTFLFFGGRKKTLFRKNIFFIYHFTLLCTHKHKNIFSFLFVFSRKHIKMKRERRKERKNHLHLKKNIFLYTQPPKKIPTVLSHYLMGSTFLEKKNVVAFLTDWHKTTLILFFSLLFFSSWYHRKRCQEELMHHTTHQNKKRRKLPVLI